MRTFWKAPLPTDKRWSISTERQIGVPELMKTKFHRRTKESQTLLRDGGDLPSNAVKVYLV